MEWQQLLRCWMYHWHHTELRAEVQSERNLVRRTRVRVFVFRCACLCLSTAEWLSTATAVTDLSSTASLIYDTHEGMHTRLSQSCSNSKSRRRSSKAQHWSLYSLHSSTLFLKKKKNSIKDFLLHILAFVFAESNQGVLQKKWLEMAVLMRTNLFWSWLTPEMLQISSSFTFLYFEGYSFISVTTMVSQSLTL